MLRFVSCYGRVASFVSSNMAGKSPVWQKNIAVSPVSGRCSEGSQLVWVYHPLNDSKIEVPRRSIWIGGHKLGPTSW